MSHSRYRLPRQLPLHFGSEAVYALEDLVVTGTNAAAARFVENWPDWPSPVVVIAGPPGSGKTHLATIWQNRVAAKSIRPDRIATLELAAGEAVLLEDADRGPLDEAGLFHLINTIRSLSGTLMLTARRFPAAWGIRLDDLASRLKAATVVEIGEPDDKLLAAVITKLFADRQLQVEPHVVNYLVHRMNRSLASAIELVSLVDRLSLERKSRITRALAADAFAISESAQGNLDL